MRLQHAKQAAGGWPADGPDQVQARAAIAAEVERLRWRTWNGKAKDARITLERIHALLPAFEGEPARKLRRALDAVDRYLRSQSAHLVDYAERHRAGQRVGTALTEGTANFLVNRRMAKGPSQSWGSGGHRHWRVWVIGRQEFLPGTGAERAVVDGAADLEQQVGPAPGPAHLLRLGHAPVDQEIGRALGQ